MTQQAQAEALKPCPFCGSEVVLKPSHYGDYSSVICMGNDPCEGKMSIVIPNDGLSSGIAAWNRRATARLEALHEISKDLLRDEMGKRLAAQDRISQLETQQAVQLPEPDAWRYTDARGHYRYRGKRVGFAKEYPLLKPEPLYTEQQVRAMVAAPVLGYDSGIQTGNRVTLIFNTQEDATRWFEGFADAYDAAHGTKSIALPVPLAAAPTPPAQERKPLTDEQIEWSSREAHAACDSDPVARWSTAFARAIERAHGIGATNAD